MQHLTHKQRGGGEESGRRVPRTVQVRGAEGHGQQLAQSLDDDLVGQVGSRLEAREGHVDRRLRGGRSDAEAEMARAAAHLERAELADDLAADSARAAWAVEVSGVS